MNEEKRPSIVVVSISITGAVHSLDFLQHAEHQFQGCDPRHLVKLSDGVFLVNQDECYPALIKLIDYCNQSKDVPGHPNARLMIAELSESPIVLSPQYQDAIKTMTEMGLRVRYTRFPAQSIPNRPV